MLGTVKKYILIQACYVVLITKDCGELLQLLVKTNMNKDKHESSFRLVIYKLHSIVPGCYMVPA